MGMYYSKANRAKVAIGAIALDAVMVSGLYGASDDFLSMTDAYLCTVRVERG